MPAELAEQGHSERERPLLRARAFGLELTVSFEVPGLAPATGPPAGPAARLDMVPAASIEEAWPSAAATRVLEEHIGAGPAARTIDAHPQAGYRLYARPFGPARISPSGAVVEVAPPGAAEPWSWQRFLVGRVLPWTAVL